MKKKRRVSGLTRRTFLKASAVTAAAVSCTSVIQFGCAKETADVAPVTRHLHFDLSLSPHSEGYTLQMGGTSYPISAHTAESRQLHRTANPDLQAIADENLTHYAENVAMPETVMLSWVTHADEVQERMGAHSLVLAAIHVPSASKAKAAAKARAMRANRAVAGAAASETPDVEGHVTPIDCAKALVFHHPEIMNLDADIAAQVHVHIENQKDLLIALALAISRQGKYDPDYQSGWAILDPILDEDGNRRKDEDGKDIYNYRPSDETLRYLGPAIQAILKTIKDDTDLEGISWWAADGVSAIRQSDPVVAASVVRAADGAASNQYGFEKVQTLCGVDIEIDPATTTDTVIGINIYNYWLRNLGFFVQYLDDMDRPIPLEALGLKGWMDGRFDSDDALLVGMLSPRLSVIGIPVWEKDLIRESFTIALPAGVESIRILYGGLGSTGWELENRELAKLGTGMTLILGYTVPIFMLAITTPPDPIRFQALIKWVMQPRQLAILGGIATIGDIIYSTMQHTVLNSGNEAALKAGLKIAANKGATWLFTTLVDLLVKIKEYQVEASLEKMIPFAGWGLYAAQSASTLAALAETTVECLMSPLVVENRLTFTHNIKVIIQPDVNHPGQFPATASRYIITAVFGRGNYRVIEKTMESNLSEISVTFTGVPAGGEVEINVGFYSATGWLAGHGVSARVANVTAADGGALEVPAFHIEENQVPLTATTFYSHKQKLTYNGSKHTWVETPAPTTTKADLACGSTGFNLCQLIGITMSQKANMLAYGWRASGQGVVDCDSGASGGQLFTFQNISAGTDPDSALMFSGCGYSLKPVVAYDLLGAPDGDHYVIDPSNGDFHLRKVNLANTAAGFDLSKDKSYGRFATFLDAAVIHQGVIIGINTLYSKIEVLTLPSSPSLDISAPCAVLMSGEGTREGLLHRPVALSVGSDGTIYILEEQNNRVQALDISGNPIKKFSTGGDPYFFTLKTDGETVKYLDMGVEYSGYVYVLSYVNSGYLAQDYRIDIYTPDGVWLARTEGVAAAKMVVDHWRNIYTLNYEMFQGPGGRTEPSVSQWTPSTPSAVAGLMRSVLKSFVALKNSLA